MCLFSPFLLLSLSLPLSTCPTQAMAPVGAIFGGPIAGWTVDHFGRKAAIMLVGIPYLSGYLMIVYAHMLNSAIAFKVVLLLGQFLSGVGLGWSCLTGPVSEYLSECH